MASSAGFQPVVSVYYVPLSALKTVDSHIILVTANLVEPAIKQSALLRANRIFQASLRPSSGL